MTISAAAGRRGLAAALGLASLAAPAAAQRDAVSRDSIRWTYATTFESSKVETDTTQYRTLATCLIAIQRTRKTAMHDEWTRTGLWRDTLPPEDPRYPSGATRLKPLPDTVVAVARWCANRTPLAAAVRAQEEGAWKSLLEIYLTANRDAEVAALLATVPAGERLAMVDVLLEAYQTAQPVRLKASEALLEERLRAAKGGNERILVLGQLLNLVVLVGDTAATRARAEQIMAEWVQMPADKREALEQNKTSQATMAGYALRHARRVSHRAAVLDSLRRSTLAYQRAERVLVRGERAPTITADTAPAVTADIWFRRGAGEPPPPRPRRVELIAQVNTFIDCGTGPIDVSYGYGGQCTRLVAMLRRLGKRFPALGITLVTSTTGVVVDRVVLDPAAEAEMLRRWLHDVEQLPGALAVQVNPVPFSRQPPPDRRLVKGRLKSAQYGGKRQDLIILVGRDGLIIPPPQTGINDLNYETELTQLITAALQQPN